jgi:hypothetical protein
MPNQQNNNNNNNNGMNATRYHNIRSSESISDVGAHPAPRGLGARVRAAMTELSNAIEVHDTDLRNLNADDRTSFTSRWQLVAQARGQYKQLSDDLARSETSRSAALKGIAETVQKLAEVNGARVGLVDALQQRAEALPEDIRRDFVQFIIAQFGSMDEFRKISPEHQQFLRNEELETQRRIHSEELERLQARAEKAESLENELTSLQEAKKQVESDLSDRLKMKCKASSAQRVITRHRQRPVSPASSCPLHWRGLGRVWTRASKMSACLASRRQHSICRVSQRRACVSFRPCRQAGFKSRHRVPWSSTYSQHHQRCIGRER